MDQGDYPLSRASNQYNHGILLRLKNVIDSEILILFPSIVFQSINYIIITVNHMKHLLYNFYIVNKEL